MWPVSRPIPYARNARKISEEAISKLSGSIKEYGFRVPIIVDDDDVIIAGHTRLLAAQRLGLTEVPVHIAEGLTPAQVKGLRISDNRVSQETKWDYEMLAMELSELKDVLGFDLALTAFDDHEIEPLLAADWSPKDILDNEDDEEPKKKDVPVKNAIEFTAEQFEVVAQAIFRMRDVEQETNITDGRCVELICANFLQDPNFQRDQA